MDYSSIMTAVTARGRCHWQSLRHVPENGAVGIYVCAIIVAVVVYSNKARLGCAGRARRR